MIVFTLCLICHTISGEIYFLDSEMRDSMLLIDRRQTVSSRIKAICEMYIEKNSASKTIHFDIEYFQSRCFNNDGLFDSLVKLTIIIRDVSV